jgi:membrane associated rhomboid family serine protease
VSPYITECPYCGHRLRKRAPKIDRDGQISDKPRDRREIPRLGRIKRGEIPGIRPDAHPYATMILVLLGVIGCLLWRTGLISIANLWVAGNPVGQWWRVFTDPFIYANTGYAFITLLCIAIFGVLMEHRHGPVVVLMLFLVGGVGGAALSGHANSDIIMGGNGAALCLLSAWVVPDLLRLVRKRDFDGDLLGVAVLAAAVILMPLATDMASWISAGLGVLGGLLLGYLLYRVHPV